MSERAPYSRVYWTVRNDPRLVSIYSDDHHWAAWNRLLIAADMAWPAPADLPATARRASVEALREAGVIELLPGGLFTFHGLDSERGRRREAARESAGRRTPTERVPDAPRLVPERSASRAEPRQDEPRHAPAPAREGLPNLNSAVSKTWEDATGRAVIGSGQFAIEYLDDACRRYPAFEVAAAIVRARQTFDHIPAAQPLIVAVRSILDPLPDAKGAAAKAAEAEESRRRRRAVESTLAGNHALGAHAAEAHPRCPSCNTGPVIVQ